LIVPGRPPAPLSLAMIVSGGGETIKVPIQLEKVPLRGNAPSTEAKQD